MKNIQKSGFTLIELLLVIAIIAVLAIVVFAALNPALRFRDSRDARRITDVESILTAIHEYIIDNRGSFPTGLSAGMSERMLGTAGTGCDTVTGGCNVVNGACLDISTPLTAYLVSIPIDPSLSTSSTKTNYSVVVNSNGIVTVKACGVEGTTNISSSR